MTTDALFDATPWEVAAPASSDPSLSADRRRTLRQREAIDAGRHPLTKGPLHPFASPETAQPDNPKGQPYTCGSCRFREVISHHNRSYPKCVRDLWLGDGHDGDTTLSEARNVSHGASTDVRAWWCACVGYEAGDQSLSSDAARSIP